MKKLSRIALFLVCVTLCVSLVSQAAAPAAAPAPPAKKAPAAAPAPAKEKATLEIENKPWTGDLDGMIKRRQIRVLVAYNKTNYFVDKGTQRGTAYDSMTTFEAELNKKLKLGKLGLHVLFYPTSRDQLFSGLVEGKGDIAVAGLTVTPERLKTVDFADPVMKDNVELIVTGPGAPAITKTDDLSGQEVFIRKSSSFYETITALNARFAKEGKKPVVIKEAPEELETEDLLEMANAGLIKITMADKYQVDFWKEVFTDITPHPEAPVGDKTNIAWAIRKDCPQLKAELNGFIKTHGLGSAFGNTVLKKYLKSFKYVKSSTSEEEMKKFKITIDLFRKYGEQYQVDWLLMGAQGYQESRLDQNAKSQVGAIGVMQLMPATGKDMNVGDIARIDANIHAGIKYMRFMMDTYYKDDPMDNINKMLMTFASYNCGPGRMRTLRKEAAKQGYNPNLWFNNVERVVAQKVGQETVTYVSNIYKYYVAYKLILQQKEQKEQVKEKVSGSH